MKRNDVARDPLSARSGWWLFLVIALVVAAIGFFFDNLIVKEGLPKIAMLVLSNTITGLFAGGLFYQMAREERANRDLVRARMKTIAELNHHIRNALQVIKFLGAQRSSLDAMQLQLINDSVERIEWALREVLPRYEVEAPTIPIDSKIEDQPQANTAGPAA